MNSILFFPEAADDLNRKVIEKIDKHLFLFCNYNPYSLRSYSYDAKFFLGVMNMYKLLIDTGICNKIGDIKKKYSLSFDYDKLKDIILIINSFRTYLGHNLDHRNANEDDKFFVESWFLRLIGKKYPENAEQYEKPLAEMTKYGEECIKLLSSFVEEVSKHAKKNEIIDMWVKLIFKFYDRPNSLNIIKGRIKLAYQARKGTVPKNLELALWTKSMLFYKEQSDISTLENLAKIPNLRTKNKELKVIRKKININNKLIQDKERIIAEHQKKKVSELKPFDYLDYYVVCFPNRIREKFTEGTLESLLPQDVVDQIIEDDYSSVPV